MRRFALLWLLLAATPTPAAPLGESLYPGLVEFDEAFELYAARDFERARTGFRHLAELGDPEAQLNLGVMLAKGEGGPVDRIEGAAWVRRAEAGGLEQATAIREVLEGGLDQDQLEEIAVRLEVSQPPATPEPESLDSATDCELEFLQRAPARYPEEAALGYRMGLVKTEAAIDGDGLFGAVHSLYGFGTRDAFALAAEQAITGWLANTCHRISMVEQSIIFEFEDIDAGYAERRRQHAARLLEAARSGDATTRFSIALLADTYPDLFDLQPGEAEAFARSAAVAGLPEARYWLDSRRWILLAARQGHAPALYRVSRWKTLPAAERKGALIAAARGGHEIAIYDAARWLAAHPDAAERDGALALSLTGDLTRRQLFRDTLLAQAHAMALAETGRFREAARQQERVVKSLRRSDRPTRLAEERLQAYEAGQAWRDSTLPETDGQADPG